MTGILVGLGALALIVITPMLMDRRYAGDLRTRWCSQCGYRHNRRGYATCQRCGRDRRAL